MKVKRRILRMQSQIFNPIFCKQKLMKIAIKRQLVDFRSTKKLQYFYLCFRLLACPKFLLVIDTKKAVILRKTSF
ncbi:unnamed protein product [Paramecium sonneborni]|uniref:Uncharacterized protein n=1 Tax=Paramecium sonneborni TaxID=65129 RepID=A0A8S1QQI6_9CILI|nr:unnamed protein product [Paramecium sonneborni]